MATVTVRLFAGAAAAAGCRELTLDADSVGAVAEQLQASFGEGFGRVLRASSLLVNEVVARGDFYSIPVHSDTTVDVLPPFAGG